MNATRKPAALALAALICVGAKPNDVPVVLLFWGPLIAVFVLLGLPFGLAFEARFPRAVGAVARAASARTTAAALAGAGSALAVLFLLAATAERAPAVAVLLTIAAAAWFLIGLTGCARRTGETLCPGAAPRGLRPLVTGWLVRSGLFAVPLLWPLLAAWVTVLALGAPLVALLRRDADPPPAT